MKNNELGLYIHHFNKDKMIQIHSSIGKGEKGTAADSSTQPIVNSSADIEANPMLAEVRYFLCSSVVVEHFPNLEKSKPFKSGYSHDYEDLYFVIATNDFDSIDKYYKEVIEPFNQKSNVADFDFWARECCNSQIDEAPKGSILKCKTFGIFKAIEKVWGLTNEKNRAFAIFKMASYYDINPIEFVNRIGS